MRVGRPASHQLSDSVIQELERWASSPSPWVSGLLMSLAEYFPPMYLGHILCFRSSVVGDSIYGISATEWGPPFKLPQTILITTSNIPAMASLLCLLITKVT